jgi:DNA-binding response OmpR family regulator
MQILVIEDDFGQADELTRLISSAGHNVKSVASAELADDALKGALPDLILLDIGLPGMNGLDYLQKIRSEGSRIPVILVTGRCAVEDRVCGLNLGADDYVTKPYVYEELLVRIYALARRAARSKN